VVLGTDTLETVETNAAGASIGAKRLVLTAQRQEAATGLVGFSLLRGGNDIHITAGTVLEFMLVSDLTFVP